MNLWWKRGLVAVGIALLLGIVIDLVQSMGEGPGKKGYVNFTGQTLAGKEWSLAEHRGKRPVVLSFFATWCGPCRMEYPHLLELRQKYTEEDLQVVLLTEEDPALIREDPDYSKSPLPILTNAGEIFKSYDVPALPRTVVFNAAGEVAEDVTGFDVGAFARIEKMLQAKK